MNLKQRLRELDIVLGAMPLILAGAFIYVLRRVWGILVPKRDGTEPEP